jgi:acetyltransferase-like isoleucine patch superfamily enzyme
VIEDDVFMAPGVTIANDIHPGCALSRKCMRGPVIEKGVQIGVNATILPFVRIGKHSLIGSGAVVTKDVPPFSVVYGNPGRVAKKVQNLRCVTGLAKMPYPGLSEKKGK